MMAEANRNSPNLIDVLLRLKGMKTQEAQFGQEMDYRKNTQAEYTRRTDLMEKQYEFQVKRWQQTQNSLNQYQAATGDPWLPHFTGINQDQSSQDEFSGTVWNNVDPYFGQR